MKRIIGILMIMLLVSGFYVGAGAYSYSRGTLDVYLVATGIGFAAAVYIFTALYLIKKGKKCQK